MFLGDRYLLQDPLVRASNGLAIVYRGRDMHRDRDVAIKVLREIYSRDPKFVLYFQREASVAATLQHPNIVQIYDYGQANGTYYSVMELVEGTDLHRYLRARGILPVDQAVFIAQNIGFGLGAAHQRSIVHRAVDPQHVLLGQDGSVKLTSFSSITRGFYYAPEQIQGGIVTPATDIYMLGMVMYEMLTGHTLFDGDTPVELAMQHIHDTPIPPSKFHSSIPPSLEEIVLRCLEKVPERRYQDGTQVAYALKTLVGA
jgi:eukaryotic-like serine/threonine-protein kinase